MSHNPKHIHRRGFLAGAGAFGMATFLNPAELLLRTMTADFISKAEAGTLDAAPRNYVNVMLMGAPSRYVFDQWLRTSDADPGIVFNPMVATRYTASGGRAGGVEYATFKYNNVLVPHMFSHNVASGNGTQRPLTDLLNNMLVIRGYGSNLDGHPLNAQLQQAPVGGLSSISGCAADVSQKYFQAVQWPERGTYHAYTSMQGKALNKISGTTPLNSLLEGFGPAVNKAARNLRERNQETFDKAAAVLKNYTGGFGAGSLNGNLDNALALMKKGIAGVDSYWNPAVTRYRTLIQDSMRASGLLGISDNALISDESRLWGVHLTDGSTPVLSKDLDLRNAMATVNAATSLAEGFALVEYILKEDLGSAVEIATAEIPNITFARPGVSGTSPITLTMDMHETGAMTSLLICTAFYRGLAAAILELSRQLGTEKWGNTVLQVMGDFGRRARSNGSGSDHGFNQMVTSVYSGAITNGPFVVGNILQTPPTADGGYGGSQGVGTGIDGYNQKGVPTPAAAASTVAALLSLPKNPFENIAAPLVKLESGQMNVMFPGKVKAG